MVSDEKLMAYLLKTGSEGREKSETPLFPLPFNPEGLELQEKDIRGVTVIAIQGHIQQVVQSLPGSRLVFLNNYSGSSAVKLTVDYRFVGHQFLFYVNASPHPSSILGFIQRNERTPSNVFTLQDKTGFIGSSGAVDEVEEELEEPPPVGVGPPDGVGVGVVEPVEELEEPPPVGVGPPDGVGVGGVTLPEHKQEP